MGVMRLCPEETLDPQMKHQFLPKIRDERLTKN